MKKFLLIVTIILLLQGCQAKQPVFNYPGIDSTLQTLENGMLTENCPSALSCYADMIYIKEGDLTQMYALSFWGDCLQIAFNEGNYLIYQHSDKKLISATDYGITIGCIRHVKYENEEGISESTKYIEITFVIQDTKYLIKQYEYFN